VTNEIVRYIVSASLHTECINKFGDPAIQQPIILCAITECFTCLSHHLGIFLSVHLSVHSSHPGTVSKRCKLKSQNLHHALVYSFCDKILCPWFSGCRGSPQTRVSKRVLRLKDVILTLLALLL